MTFLAGEWRHCAPLHAVMAEATKREGRANESCEYRCFQAACLISLGEFAAAKAALALAAEGARSLPASAQAHMQIRSREKEFAWALDQGWHSISDDDDLRFGPADNPIKGWGASALYTAAARAKARLGFTERAMELLAYAMPEIERGIAGLGNYPRMICNAASALWEGNIATWADRIQCNLITKVIEPDFRYPMVDARLAAAQLCALQGRIDEASEWFAKARKVLEEQGARPLRAICDHDEALALVRHSRKTGTRLDRPRVRELLDKASTQFVDIGMTGWITRAADLTAEVG